MYCAASTTAGPKVSGLEVFVEEGGGAEGAVGFAYVGGDAAGFAVAEGAVEGFRKVAGAGVEHEDGAVGGVGLGFDGVHEGAGEALAAGGAMHDELLDFGAVVGILFLR